MTCVMNAANEAAVDAYCKEIITLPMIYECVQSVMQQHNAKQLDSLDTAIDADISQTGGWLIIKEAE